MLSPPRSKLAVRLPAVRARLARIDLPHGTLRLRLTVVYALLFLVSGATLLAITYALVDRASGGASSFSYTDGDGRTISGTVNGGDSDRKPAAEPTQLPPEVEEVGRRMRALEHEHVMHQLLVVFRGGSRRDGGDLRRIGLGRCRPGAATASHHG